MRFIFFALLAALYLFPIYPHIRLSKRDNRYLGLIFPGIYFLLSILLAMGMQVVPDAPFFELGRLRLWALAVGNLPAVLYLLIYLSCRSQRTVTQEHMEDA